MGARFFAGEKCCCKVEKAGLLSCGSACAIRDTNPSGPFVGGRWTVDALSVAEVDFAREWLAARVVEEKELVEGVRKCRKVVSGGLERSCLTGSVLWLVLDCRFEDDLCSPPVVGLPMLARGGGTHIEALLAVVLAALGGLADVDVILRDAGLMGSRLGE